MKRFGAFLLLFIVTFRSGSLLAQTFIGPEPWFTLSISEKQLPDAYAPGTHALDLKYTNVSNFVQQDNCVVTVGAYRVEVLHDGKPIQKKELMKKPSVRSPDSGRIPIQVPSTGVVPCGRIIEGIKPGESAKFPLWVSSDFDMTKPGRYDITVIRDVIVPGSPGKKVTVKSNTVTIMVSGLDPKARQ